MHQFFVSQSQIQRDKITIQGSDVNHIKHVLRMETGDEINVADGTGEKLYQCVITGFTEAGVELDIVLTQEQGTELPSKIYLFQGLPKGDKMELIIQKAVELGVYEIIPVETRRAVVKLDEKKAAAKCKRWQTISESACKQSKRLIIPEIHRPMSFSEALSWGEKMDVRLIPYELAEGMAGTRRIVEGIRPGQSVAVFIGPEGGFDEEEIRQARDKRVVPVTLGKRILRTETAGLSVLSILMYHLEGRLQ